MSEIRETLAGVLTERAPSFSDPVRNLRTGTRFQAELEPVLDLEANVLLGRDARESVIFHVTDPAAGAAIRLNDVLEAVGGKFRVLRRTDNPANLQMDFGTMKVTSDDA